MSLRLLIACNLLFCVSFAFAQKNDYKWALGLGPGWSDFNFFYDFHTDPPSIQLRNDPMSTGVFTASYCDDAGEIQAYSNGLWILNKHGQLIENSSGLNPTLASGQTQGSYLGNDSGFFLAKPDDPSILYLIHLDYGYHPANGWPYRYIGRHLLVTTIDLNANNGSGKTISKNVSLLDGVLMTAAAVRHANGRDWWIMCSDADENRHYRLLLTPDGFKGPFTQEIGTKPSPIGLNNSGFGNSFSSKGNYYVDGNSYLGFSIFRFNRCTGLLSDERRVEWPEPLTPPNDNQQHEPGGGYMFSADENFLYVTASFDLAKHPALPVGSKPYLFQFDLSASDLFASIDTINPIDSLKFFPYAYTDEVMYGAEMGPDGRIYIMHNGEAYCTVQYPNVRGKGCGFRYNEPNFNNIIGQAIPVLPNYRLGPIDGSACDTLGLNNIPVANFRTDDTLGLLARFFYDLSFKEPTNWFWNFGDGTTSQDTSLLHEFAEPGKYQVCLTVSNSNGSDTYCREVFIGISAQKEPSPANLDLRVFPNPAQESVTIVILGASPASGTLTVSDLHGRLVLQQPFRAVNSQLLDLRGWQPGVYFLSLETTDGNRQVRRLFVGP